MYVLALLPAVTDMIPPPHPCFPRHCLDMNFPLGPRGERSLLKDEGGQGPESLRLVRNRGSDDALPPHVHRAGAGERDFGVVGTRARWTGPLAP